MGHDLVAEKAEINPLLRTAPLGTAKHSPIKMAGSYEIVYREGDVKRT